MGALLRTSALPERPDERNPVPDPLLLMLIVLAVMMIPMFLTSNRQRKMMRAQQEALAQLGVGDEVRTRSGFYGIIVEEFGDTVILESESGAQLKWDRAAIDRKVEIPAAGADDAALGGAAVAPLAAEETVHADDADLRDAPVDTPADAPVDDALARPADDGYGYDTPAPVADDDRR